MPWWNFWKPQTEEELQAQHLVKQRQKEQSETIAALQRGDLPPIATERIRKHREQDQFFTSTLSVNEFLQLKEVGVEPIAQVMGTSFFSTVFFIPQTRYPTGELSQLTQAQTDSRSLAVKRMQQEAKLLGASGVVGVQIKTKRPNMKQPHTEFTAYGTAIKVANYPPSAEPFTSNLSGQEFCQLYKSGFQPKGLIMGYSLYYVATDPNTMNQRNAGLLKSAPNQEVTRYTKACYAARRKAMARFEEQLIASKANGAVGVDIRFKTEGIDYDRGQYTVQDMVVHFTVVGTAIQKVHAETPVAAPLMYMDLRDRAKSNTKIELKEFVPKKP